MASSPGCLPREATLFLMISHVPEGLGIRKITSDHQNSQRCLLEEESSLNRSQRLKRHVLKRISCISVYLYNRQLHSVWDSRSTKCVGMTSLKGGEGHIRRVFSAFLSMALTMVCARYFNRSTEICLSHPGREHTS